jgi:hypothetical protein
MVHMINNRWCTICCRKSMIMYVKRNAHSNKKKDTCSSCHTHTHPQLSCINRLFTQVVSHTEFSWRKVAVIGQLQLFSAPRFSITCKPLSSSSPSELSQLHISIVHIQLHLHAHTSIASPSPHFNPFGFMPSSFQVVSLFWLAAPTQLLFRMRFSFPWSAISSLDFQVWGSGWWMYLSVWGIVLLVCVDDCSDQDRVLRLLKWRWVFLLPQRSFFLQW